MSGKYITVLSSIKSLKTFLNCLNSKKCLYFTKKLKSPKILLFNETVIGEHNNKYVVNN
jgi:hypothetical protein